MRVAPNSTDFPCDGSWPELDVPPDLRPSETMVSLARSRRSPPANHITSPRAWWETR
jgi:hypothetical protein